MYKVFKENNILSWGRENKHVLNILYRNNVVGQNEQDTEKQKYTMTIQFLTMQIIKKQCWNSLSQNVKWLMLFLGAVEVEAGKRHSGVSYRRSIQEDTYRAKHTGTQEDIEEQPIYHHSHIRPVSLCL